MAQTAQATVDDRLPDETVTKFPVTSPQQQQAAQTYMESIDPQQQKHVQDIEAYIQQKNVEDQQTAGRMGQRLGYADKMITSPIQPPAPPKLQNIPERPVLQARDAFQVFQSPAILLATLGSAFTRRGAVNALNAGAGALNGFMEGDKEKMELEEKNWKNAVEQTIEQNDVELKGFDAVFKNTELAERDRNARLTGLFAANGDELKMNALKTGNMEALEKLRTMQFEAGERLKQSYARYQSATLVDQGILNELVNYPGMDASQLGYIPKTEQPKVKAAFQSGQHLEEIAAYVKENPATIGIVADAARRMNLDAYQSMFGSALKDKTEEDMSSQIDRSARDPSMAAKAKILSKMLTTQAFADAASAGSRGATIYLDKAFREIYQQASSPDAFYGILEKRYNDSNRVLEQYHLGFDRSNAPIPFWRQKAQGFVHGGSEFVPKGTIEPGKGGKQYRSKGGPRTDPNTWEPVSGG